MLTKDKRRQQRRKRNQIARQLHEGRTGPYRLQVHTSKRLKKKLKKINLDELGEVFDDREELSETIHERTILDDIQGEV